MSSITTAPVRASGSVHLRSRAEGPAEPAELTIVVVTFNSERLLPDLLRSLRMALAGIESATLVVADNASSDGTVAYLRERAPEATIVQLPTNRGYAAGINAALAAAQPSGPVLILNPDVRLEAGAVKALLAALRTPGTGVAAPLLIDDDGRLQFSQRRDPTVLRAVGEALLSGPRAGRFERLGEVVSDPQRYYAPATCDWASGAVWMISPECQRAVGQWDESLFLYSEEADFAARARRAGFDIRFVPDAVAIHLGGESGTSPDLWTMLTVNRVRHFARGHGAPRTLAFWAAVTLNEAVRAAAGRTTSRAALEALLDCRTLTEALRRTRSR